MDFESTDFNQNIKVTSIDGHKFKLKGSSGYETIFIKKPVKEGAYLVSFQDVTHLESKKKYKKACFRIGVHCTTEDEDLT